MFWNFFGPWLQQGNAGATIIVSTAMYMRNFPRGTSCQGTLVQFADLQIRPPTMQPEVLSVDPSIDILPE
jgi:hypothetical protein